MRQISFNNQPQKKEDASLSNLPLEQIQTQTLFERISRFQKGYPNIAYFYACLGNICLIFMQANMKMVCKYLNPIYALAIRGICLLIINSVVIHYASLQYILCKAAFRILVKRVLLSGMTVVLYLSPLAYIPSSTVNSLFNTSPIIVCFVESYFYKKPLNKIHLLLTVICFMGIIIVIKPDFLFKGESVYYQNQKMFMLISLMSALTNSISMIYLHKLKGRLNPTIVLQYSYVSQILINNCILNFQQLDFSNTQFDVWLCFYAFGFVIFAYLTQNLITKAVMKKKPSYLMPFGYITILGSALIDSFIFGNSFDMLTIIGMLLTSCGLFVKLIIPQQTQEAQKISNK